MELETRSVYPATVEIRQEAGGGQILSGRFLYGAQNTAVISNRGTVRKERFMPGAFRYSIEREDFDINLLAGHSFDRPIASKSAGSLTFRDGPDALEFSAALPLDSQQPSWVRDTVLAVQAGSVRGISPGFSIPPRGRVPNAERLVQEPGNPGVSIRELADVLLAELSLVTRPAYSGTAVDLRSEYSDTHDMERRYRWLLV